MVLYCVIQRQKKNVVTLLHSAQRKHAFLGEIKQMSKGNQLPSRNRTALEFLQQILGHRSTRSLMAGDNDNVWKDIELRIDPYPFCTSCQISYMNKKARCNIPLMQKSPFNWVLWI